MQEEIPITVGIIGHLDAIVNNEHIDKEDAVESIFDLKGSVISLACNRVSDLAKNIIKLPKDPLLEVIKQDISICKKENQIDALYYHAGKEALIENGNWYLIFEKKGPELEGIGI